MAAILMDCGLQRRSVINVDNEAPNQSLWFHGRLSRRDAETRLQQSLLNNCYLVRESDRKPGSYVLSYFGETGINHFRVTAICGDYYIGGRQFRSLSEMISYYTYNSDLLKNERLVEPISPPEPVNDLKRMVAVLPYSKMPETDEMSFKKGDIFVVHNDCGDGWLWCTKFMTQEAGLVFRELLEELDDNIDCNEVYSWFHSRITKEEAVEKLAKAGPGSFLVRPSDNSPGNYSLFFHIANSVQRFRIERRANRYIMGGRIFASLEAVIERYKTEQIVEGFRLLIPVSKAPFEIRWTSKHAEEVRLRGDVYATLRESREMVKKNQSIRMSGYLFKKSQMHKKWKSFYFVLNSKESMLYFYESPRRTRPKGLVDLSYSHLYLVHDSLFDRQNCFQLLERALPCISTIYYLCANDSNSAQEWMSAIKQFCSQNNNKNTSNIEMIGNSIVGNVVQQQQQCVTQMRTLYICLLEARALPVKCCLHPFVIISLNSVKVCRTQVKCPPDPIWEEDFVLEDIPQNVTSFTFTLYNKGKRSKDVEYAEATVELSRLNSGEEIEESLALNGLCPVREDWGSLRVRIRYVHEIIMPLTEYSALKDLLFSDDLEVISICEQFCYRDRGPLANALLKIAKHERKETQLIKAMIEREIKSESDTSTLFRANSLTTSLIDQYMKSCCHQFLHKALYESITKVLESKQSCELNPSKLESELTAIANAENLLNFLDIIVESIFKCVNDCPIQLRYICGCLQRAVHNKWPNDYLVRTRVVSGFIFLRLICPAILNPRQFSLINETPSETASRSLLLVAKSLQNLANLVEFGIKRIFITADRFGPPPNNSKMESWMEIVNPFILKNKARMIKFLDDLSQQSSQQSSLLVNEYPMQQQLESTTIYDYDPSRELSTIHSICEIHIQEIVAQQSPIMKKLSTVIEMLTKHKQRYTDLIK